MANLSKFVSLALFVTSVKLLLVPSYKSTDFEVHRNWLAITHSLPISDWYRNSVSEWTLDYPPFFAWFEWALSHAAKLADPNMLVVENLEYDSQAAVIFQRCSVIAADSVLLLAAWLAPRCGKLGSSHGADPSFLIAANAGLLLVDHIHFQYNGIMIGVLLLATLAATTGRPLLAAFLYAALLNAKHLFAYAAPAFFVFLLRTHCTTGRLPLSAARFCQLAAVVLLVCAASLGPFVAMGQLPQVLRRLFPFGRGLTHSYWAANIWAAYSAADKVLAAACRRLGLPVQAVVGNLTGGVVGIQRFAVLPQVSPGATMAAVLAALLPCLAALWRHPAPGAFPAAVAYSNLCGFMFGYHVHEKAILPAILPLALVVTQSPSTAADFLLLSTAGHYGLLPLLYQPQEYPTKLLLVAAYAAAALVLLSQPAAVGAGSGGQAGGVGKGCGARAHWPAGLQWLTLPQVVYLLGFVPLEVYATWVHPVVLRGRLPFLPLMLTSLYCTVGVGWVWCRMAVRYLQQALTP